MSTVLHITNGDGAAAIIKASGVAGDVLSWQDPMHHGPFPKTQSLDDISRIRIRYLTDETGDDAATDAELLANQESLTVQSSERLSTPADTNQSTHGFSERDATLERSHEYDEVVLWFEHDLLDQLQLLQLLDWYAQQAPDQHNLHLICIGEFEGVANFRGLGVLTGTQMASLYPQRTRVTQSQLTIASEAWAAFCHSEPTELLALCSATNNPFPAMPYLNKALLRHFEDYPWAKDGLTRTERQLLSLVDTGVTAPPKVFSDNMDFESSLYIGDWRTYTHLAQLCNAPQPLLECNGGEQFLHPREATLSFDDFRAQQLSVSDYGKQVLTGGASALDTMHRSSWLGGVYLNANQPMWCWDNDNSRLIKSTG